ncbi:MAG: 2'-5' RNA ligase family protein [Dehalococcoidia bacterium]|nr:2'-5' RNA ligase family protein [Dehalococcoidia bacterium]
MSDASSNTVRLFIACEVPEDVQGTIGDIIDELHGEAEGAVRWTNPANVHVTLKFLGEVPQKKLPGIKMALGEAGDAPFALQPGAGPDGPLRWARRPARDVGRHRR